MKVTMDLLPGKYKCIPRAWTGIYILIVMIFINVALYFSLNWWYTSNLSKMKKLGEERLKHRKAKIARLKISIESKKKQLEKVTLPPNEILDLNKQIEFFNKIYGKSFSWYEFFSAIERLTPKNVWIKDIKITPGDSIVDQEFEIMCESTDPYLAPEFLKNLMNVKEFTACKGLKGVYLSRVLKTPEGGHEFSLKFKYLPIKDHWIIKAADLMKKDPSKVAIKHITVMLGQSIALRLVGKNIAGEKIVYSPMSYNVENSDNNVGLWDKYKEIFTGRAPGICELYFTDLNRTPLVKFTIEVR